MTEDLVILGLLVLLSGFFSSAELAFFSLSNLRVKHLYDNGVNGSRTLKYVKDRPRKLLNTILIGNNLVNIGASVYATALAIDAFSSNVIGIVTGVMTFMILVFGEIIPKSFAINHSEHLSLAFARPFKFLMLLCYPLIILLDFIGLIFNVGNVKKKPLITEEEIKSYIKTGEEIGQISRQEKNMIQRVFRFDDINVNEIMTPRTEMTIFNSKHKAANVVSKILKSGLSRYPVFEKNRDHIIGVIHAWDIMKAITEGKKDITLRELMAKPNFVPQSMKIDEMLKSFLRRKHHMAIVVDEYGGTAGLITLEDVLEEVVGEIIDERDKVEPEIIKTGKKSWKVLGRADVDKFSEKFKMSRKRGDFDTVNGFLLDKLGRIPKEKEVIQFRKYKVIIKEVTGNRVREIRVVRK